MMTERQREKLFAHQQTVMLDKKSKMEAKVKELLPAERKVTPMLKLKIISLHESDMESKSCKFYLSINSILNIYYFINI